MPDEPNIGHPDARNIEREDVYEAGQLAIKTGITGDQAQELIDRITGAVCSGLAGRPLRLHSFTTSSRAQSLSLRQDSMKPGIASALSSGIRPSSSSSKGTPAFSNRGAAAAT